MNREEIRWIPKKPECSNGNTAFITVDINVIEPAIILLLVGYGFSMIIVLVEQVYFKYYKRLQGSTLTTCYHFLFEWIKNQYNSLKLFIAKLFAMKWN